MVDSSKQETGSGIADDPAGYSPAAAGGASGLESVAGSLAWGGSVAVTSPVVVATGLVGAAIAVYAAWFVGDSPVIQALISLGVKMIAATAIVAVGRQQFFGEERSIGSVVAHARTTLADVVAAVAVVELLVLGILGFTALFGVMFGEYLNPLVVSLALVGLVVVLLAVGVRTVFVVPAVVVDEVDALDGIALSWASSRGHLLAALVLLVVAAADEVVRQTVLPVVDLPTLGANVLLAAIVFAISTLALTRFYLLVREDFAA